MIQETLPDALLLILASAAVIWGVHGVTRPGFIFDWIADRLDKSLPDLITKPLYGCSVCMPTVYVPLVALLSGHFTIPIWLIAWLGTSGLNYIIMEFLYPEEV